MNRMSAIAPNIPSIAPIQLSTMAKDPNNPEVLIAVPNEIEAMSLVTALSGYGIEASITGSYTSGFRAEAPGQVQVIVRHIDLDRAKDALAEITGSNGAG